MPITMDVYLCPVCDNAYASLKEAEECLERCKDAVRVEDAILFACTKCGASFPSEESATYHEDACRSVPNEKGTAFTCEHCRHRDAEGLYYSPCRQCNHAKPVPACESFELATS